MTEKMPHQQEMILSRAINSLIGPKMSRELALKLVKKLQVLYGQPGRYYHNFRHILQVISFLEDNLDQISNPRVAYWAALYHDIIYDTHSKFGQNEEESAEFAISELSDKLPDEELSQISLFVRATADHSTNLINNDLCLFLDADISIFGTTPEGYSEYAINIRKEYEWATNEHYDVVRIEVLQDFLNRKQIYMTDTANNTLEVQARININDEIEQLLKH